MLGRNHAAIGVASFAGATWAGTHLFHLGALDAHQAVAGTVVAIGAALAPDLDEAHSTAGGSNPISDLPIFGGHRRRSHCIAAVAAVTAVALACATNIDPTAIAAGAVPCVPFGALFGYATARWVHPGWWLIAAVAVPYFSRLLGDTITPGGVPCSCPYRSDGRSRCSAPGKPSRGPSSAPCSPPQPPSPSGSSCHPP